MSLQAILNHTRNLHSFRFSNGVVLLRWATTSVRLLSTGASTITTPEEDEKEQQRMKDEETMYENDIKIRILDAALGHVDENGWKKETLAIGAEAVGYPGVTHGLFPKGGVELVHHFYRQCNLKLSLELENEIKEAQLDPSKKKKTFKFVRDSIEKRLRMNEQHVVSGRWIEAMGLMALPPNVPASLRHFSELVDDIWYYAGDSSADFSWYTKRATLGAIYKSTELCMIQDKTENFENTWEFLDRRMNDVGKLNLASRRLKESSEVISGMCRTAMNIIGIDNNKRR